MRIAWLVTILSLSSVACAMGGAKSSASYAYAPAAAGGPPPNAQVAADPTAASAGPGSTMAIPEALVIEGSLAVQVEEIGDLLPALHTAVAGMQGRIVNEVVSGAENSWSAILKIRVPPQHVDALVDIFAKRGVITEKRINATDVSKQLFDQELAIKNLRTTLDRLTLLMQKDGLNVQQILEVEKEMTRVRGQIDQLEGDHRFLKDRVGLATLDVSLSRAAGSEVTVATAKAYPGARFATLVLIDPGSRPRTRIGGGFVIHSLLRNMSIELDMFRKEPDGTGTNASREFSAIATIGGATYSEFLGNGKRQFGNPYLGMRLGYAYLDGSRFVAQGEAGLELFKSKYVILDASVRASGLIGSEADMAVVLGAGAVFAF